MGVAMRLRMARAAKAVSRPGSAGPSSDTGQAGSSTEARVGTKMVAGPTNHVVQAASDMWAVGVVAWELLTGSRLFGDNFTDEDVVMVLLGFKPLPFEADPSLWVLFHDPQV